MKHEPDEKRAVDLFGDGSQPASTRDRLIVAAFELFHAYGFHAVGLDQILAEVGVTKTTFYNHFASKDDLAVEAVRLRDHWDAQAFARELYILAENQEARSLLIAAFDVLDRWFRHPDFAGCLFLNACHEFPSPHHPVRQAASAHYVRANDMLRDIASRGGAADPAALADQLTLLMEGAFTMRQVSGQETVAVIAREIACRLVDEALPGVEPDAQREDRDGLPTDTAS